MNCQKSEIRKYLQSEEFQKEQKDHPSYYWVVLLGAILGIRIGAITSLLKSQIVKHENNFYFIRIIRDKTSSGKRDVPLPQYFIKHGFLDYLNSVQGEHLFTLKELKGRGTGNAPSKKFNNHIQQYKETNEKKSFHSLRKMVNQFLLENDFPFESRCQFMGHEIDHVNVQTYARRLTIEELNTKISPILELLCEKLGLVLKEKI